MKPYSAFAFALVLVFLNCTAFGQTQHYRLKGIVNVDTGTVTLLPMGGKEYDPNPKNNYQAKIRQGIFTFDGQMAYPCDYLIRINQNYVSSDFIIEPGNQTIVCTIDSLREIPKLANKSMEEYRLYVTNYVEPIAKQREQAFDDFLNQKSATTDKKAQDSLQTIYQKIRTVLIHKQQNGFFDYATQHPNSYVALWRLVREMKDGYQPMFDSIYSAFSPTLKQTQTGQVLGERLRSSRVTAIGHVFPSLNLLDTENNSVTIPTSAKSRYTLVDFWFSHCGPCLSEFPKLKELFNLYRNTGFNIIGISTDKKIEIETWKKTIKERGLTWSQYVDVSGQLTTNELSINYFPTNFLLDEKGTIIRKNISPGDLQTFLVENLKTTN